MDTLKNLATNLHKKLGKNKLRGRKMKRKTIFKIVFTLLVTIAIIAVSGNVLAANEECTILKKTNEEYVIYVKASLDQEFEFAYTNKVLENDDELDYIKSAKDSEKGTAIAYVDSSLYTKYFKDAENTYLWAKRGTEYLAKGIKIDLSKAISEDMVAFVKNTTKRIAVNTEKKDEVVTEKDGIKYTTTTGKIEITADSKLQYAYVMVNVANSKEYADLVALAEKLNNMEAESNVTKIENSKEFYDLYEKLLSEVDNKAWVNVENMQIPQPKESKTGDKYVVWIRQGNENNATYDVQFMTCYNEENKEFIKEDKVIKTTSKLPITYDSIALFVVLGIAVILFAVVLVVRNKSKKETK